MATLRAKLRLAARALAILTGFLVLVPVHVAASVAGRPDAIPPVFLGYVGRMAGLRVRSHGHPRPGALFLANHESWLDILALAGTTRARFVAHSGLAGHPVLRWLCEQNGTVFVTRDRRGTVAEQVGQVRAALGERPLVVFPEATTNDGIELLPFRSSLLSAVEPLAAEVPIQPVALEYTDAPNVCWYGDEPGLANVRRILSRPGRVELTLHFLEPLAGNELANRKTMTAAVRRAIADTLQRV